MRLVFAVVVAAASGACASAALPPATPYAVTRSEVVPAGYLSLGRVTAECSPVREWKSLRGVPATSLFCDRPSLERALDEQARRRGATVLAGLRCHEQESGARWCAATAAKPGAGTVAREPASTAAPTDSDALSLEVARRIEIDLEPSVPAFVRGSRSGAEVAEHALLPVGHVELGLMRARCAADECDADQTRAGLRAAAGGLGVASLVGVRCSTFDAELTCVATLAATERDPDTDPQAR